jgi:predicted house-cleaning noncanonical NTP pyrophosphatase (MazG superfamily)
MKKKHRFKVDKLIRDKIPHLMRQQNIFYAEKIMDEEEYFRRLKDKIIEEAHEVVQALSEEEHLEELADLLEVIHALGTTCGFSFEQIDRKRLEKREHKGGFAKKIYSSHVEIDADHEGICYFRERKERYPEVL